MFFGVVCFAIRWLFLSAGFEAPETTVSPIETILRFLRKKLDRGLPSLEDASINAYCNLSQPDWLQLRSSGWQNDRCAVVMGGAEGYTNQILSMLRAYEFLRPRLVVLLPIRSEHATEAECLTKVSWQFWADLQAHHFLKFCSQKKANP